MKRVFLIMLAVVLVSCAVLVGGVWWWLQKHGDELVEMGQSALKDGAQFGDGRDGDACVAEAERRLATTSGIVAEAGNKMFLEGCLKTCAITPAFCEGIPPRDSIVQTATWALARCGNVPAGQQQACARLIGAVQERCLKPR